MGEMGEMGEIRDLPFTFANRQIRKIINPLIH